MGDVEVFDAGGAAANAAGDSAHLADTVDAHDASAISVVPAGTIAATDAQAALEEISGDVTALDVAKQPRAHPLRPTGALYENFTRYTAMTASTTVLSAGRLTMVGIYLPSGVSVASITFCSGAQALVTPAHAWAALYDNALALLRQSTDDTGATWAANTPKTFTLSSAFPTTYAGLHYLGLMIDAATVPSILGISTVTNLMGAAPVLSGTSNTGLTGTAPNPANALSALGFAPYAYVS